MKAFEWLMMRPGLVIVGVLVLSYFATWLVTGCPSPHNCVIRH